MPKRSGTLKNANTSDDRYKISIFLEPKDVEDVKAIAVAQDVSLGSVIVNLMREGLKNNQYQTIIQAYQQFKNKVN